MAMSQLIDKDEGAWLELQEWLSAANKPVDVLAVDAHQGEAVLTRLNVTTKSYLGMIAYRTGGILIDQGWLRILGGGHERLPRDLATWNRLDGEDIKQHRLPGAILIADDVLGGFFALNGGGLGEQPGMVFYLAPDTLEWESLELSYGSFVYWAMTGDLETFYRGFRWPGWQDEMATISGQQALSIYPFLCTDGPDISQRSRQPVDINEIWTLSAEQKT